MQKLAPYASKPENSRGRLQAEERFYDSGTFRSPYQRDRDRIIHSRAFRRIQHKTQVFLTTGEGDHYRTRLTHSLEVAQIARTIARSLHLDEDLTEAIALAHDIGHPPFGHDGEDVLSDKMQAHGGFNHNIQALRNVALLEKQYPNLDGLNLTYECIDGLLKHNGPLDKSLRGFEIITQLCEQGDFRLDEYSCLEAQVAAIADDVAYNNHDLEDGLRAKLISLQDLEEIPHLQKMITEIKQSYGDCPDELLLREIIRRQITAWVQGILQTTHDNLGKLSKDSDSLTSDDVRQAGFQIVNFSAEHKPIIADLRKFLMTRVYKANPNRAKTAEETLSGLFDFYMESGNFGTAREVCDYIAGMTDIFALAEYKKLIKD